MQENCIKIHKGTKESRSLIEIQSYITQLETSDYRLRRRIKDTEQLSEEYKKLVIDYKNVLEQLEHANIELAYYQSMSINKNYGRPAKLSTQEIYEIRELRKVGNTLQMIAEQYNVSIALVHKITRDIKNDKRRKNKSYVVQ